MRSPFFCGSVVCVSGNADLVVDIVFMGDVCVSLFICLRLALTMRVIYMKFMLIRVAGVDVVAYGNIEHCTQMTRRSNPSSNFEKAAKIIIC